MIRAFLGAAMLAAIAVTARADEPPPLTTLIPVLSTDLQRLASEMGILAQAAQAADARAAWWRDACVSTPECGGHQPAVVEK